MRRFKRFWLASVLCASLGFVAGQSQPDFAQAQEKEAKQPPEKKKAGPRPNDDRPPPPPKKSGPRAGDKDATTVRGKVKSFHTSPKGEVDGLTLDDGTEVRFPPHDGKKVTETIAEGDEIQVAGQKHTGPKGDSHRRAETIKNIKTDKSLSLDSMPPKDQEMLSEVRAIRALIDGSTASRSDGKVERVEGGPHDQILHELRELRKLVEQRMAGGK